MSQDGSPPPRGVRLPWDDVPDRVRTSFERWWGRRVVRSASLDSGFSPGVAARVWADDGSELFVKAVGPEPNRFAPELHRREIAVASRLPQRAPAPRLMWSMDEGPATDTSGGGWVLLAFEALAGDSPSTPWTHDAVERVIRALDDLQTSLTPSPLPADSVPLAAEAFGTWLHGWDLLRARDGPEPPLDDWTQRHLEELCALEADAADAAHGETLLHCDLRADNMVVVGDRVYVVDWPHAHVGAAWIDGLFMAPSVAMQGGPEPETFLAQLSSYRSAPERDVTAVLAAVAGFLVHASLEPPPPGLPTVRAFQAAQGQAARRWLAERLGWEPPGPDLPVSSR